MSDTDTKVTKSDLAWFAFSVVMISLAVSTAIARLVIWQLEDYVEKRKNAATVERSVITGTKEGCI